MSKNVTYADVKEILDDSIDAWERDHERTADLALHGPNFGWSTREELLGAEARGQYLIQPELIGSNDASEANIIKILKSGLPPFYPRMPDEGPYIEVEKIDKIRQRIEDGAPI